jgi:hypothetical protein
MRCEATMMRCSRWLAAEAGSSMSPTSRHAYDRNDFGITLQSASIGNLRRSRDTSTGTLDAVPHLVVS